jgi:hypothetical protein
MTGQVERDEALENQGPTGERRRQEDQQACGCAAIGDHVEDGAEPSRLFEVACCIAVERIEEARHAVEDRAGSRVEWHIVKRCECQDNSRVTWVEGSAWLRSRALLAIPLTNDIRPENEDILVHRVLRGGHDSMRLAIRHFLGLLRHRGRRGS